MCLLRHAAYLCLFYVAVTAYGNDTCDTEIGQWSHLLEQWATSAHEEPGSMRHARIMALPPTSGYYVIDRADRPHKSSYEEWPGLTPPPPPFPGKIVNRPPAMHPSKDKMKPGYGPPKPVYHNGVDRVDGNTAAGGPPRREVTETDLYLLAAIEKLVYRADLAEKRLRRVEDSLHYLLAGQGTEPDPCGVNYTRIGGECYAFSRDALDWQGANNACRRARAALVELKEPGARRELVTALQADPALRGGDWWTGGLNPGLLWIWAGSAQAVLTNNTGNTAGVDNTQSPATIQGDGRCLALSYDAAVRTYSYRGRDCALKLRYVCQVKEDKIALSNEIERIARRLRDQRESKNEPESSNAGNLVV